MMPMVGSKTDGDAGGLARPARVEREPGRLLRRIGWATITLCAAAVLLLAVGFVYFIWRLPANEIALDRDADGIVVLTGGASRIADAIELLAARRGHRLLISGANRTTNSVEISRLNPEFESVVRCCVDFDRSLNTLGNAIETRRWAEKNGFRSLIVVTSSYHMPRAMAEIGHQLPHVSLIPFPVLSERMRSESWWVSGAALRLMVSEYLKYVFTHVRIRVNPASGVAVS